MAQSRSTALIIGGSGQDGSYLCRLLLEKSYEVHILSRAVPATGLKNHQRLGIEGQVTVHEVDPTIPANIESVLASAKPGELYHLGGETSVRRSFDEPVATFNSIAGSVMNVLDAVHRLMPRARVFNAASSEMFGNCAIPATTDTPFRPHSPYGYAKVAAYNAVQLYRRAFGLFAVNGIMFNHESPLRPLHFVTRKIVAQAVEIACGERNKISLGNISSIRDWGWAPDYAEAAWRSLQADTADDYIISTGQSHSVEAFLNGVFERLNLDPGIYVEVVPALQRAGDITQSMGNPDRTGDKLGWRSSCEFDELIERLVDAELAWHRPGGRSIERVVQEEASDKP